MFGLTFAHLSLRPNFPLSGSLSFPLSRKFGLRPDRKNDFTFWINFRSAESLVSAKDERKSEPKVKVTHCAIQYTVVRCLKFVCLSLRSYGTFPGLLTLTFGSLSSDSTLNYHGRKSKGQKTCVNKLCIVLTRSNSCMSSS